MELRYLIKGLLLPPCSQIILLLFAWLLRNRLPRLARLVFLFAVLSLWALGSSAGSNLLVLSVEKDKPLQVSQLSRLDVDAIVILAATQNQNAAEFGESVSGQAQLSRIRYGAFLHRRTGLPILLSGGSVKGDEIRSLAETMAFDLEESFRIKPAWLETKSRTTADNAKYSYEVLAPDHKTTIALVTNSIHMMRAKWLFENAGFTVIAAPTDFIDRKPLRLNSFIPTSHNLDLSTMVLHEWLGYCAYRIGVGVRS